MSSDVFVTKFASVIVSLLRFIAVAVVVVAVITVAVLFVVVVVAAAAVVVAVADIGHYRSVESLLTFSTIRVGTIRQCT